MASTGVGSVIGMGLSPFDSLANAYGYQIQKPALRGDLLRETSDDSHVLEDFPGHPGMARLNKEGYADRNDYSGSRGAYRIFQKTKTSSSDLESAILERQPELHKFLTHLKAVRALDFSSNAAGRAIAVLTWQRVAPDTAISLDQLLSF